ncbi:hypothetical protein [Azovibrio restrictus]|uniref:hypothetical protein n=1 Tax=Azovibrio restrictus TaxID=146938 RepID=UPI0026F060D3|nr:hypothetical protein [Azovibrio restrictus]
MKTARKTNSHQAWLFDGKPEFVDVNVASSTPVEGGYVVAMELTTGAIRLAATRQPAKYVSAWRHNVRRYGVPDIVRVLVSRPYLRYEAVKRGLAGLLAEYKDADSEAFRVSIETLTEKAQTLWAEARPQP